MGAASESPLGATKKRQGNQPRGKPTRELRSRFEALASHCLGLVSWELPQPPKTSPPSNRKFRTDLALGNRAGRYIGPMPRIQKNFALTRRGFSWYIPPQQTNRQLPDGNCRNAA